MAREGQGYPCYQHDMMMMMIHIKPVYQPRLNGQVERFVDSFKRGLKKINREQNKVLSLQNDH